MPEGQLSLSNVHHLVFSVSHTLLQRGHEAIIRKERNTFEEKICRAFIHLEMSLVYGCGKFQLGHGHMETPLRLTVHSSGEEKKEKKKGALWNSFLPRY